MPKLRNYQIKDLNKIVAAFNAGTRRVLYQLPTGAGKTVVFCDLIRQVAAAELPVLVLVHRAEILQQVSKSLLQLGVKHGIIAPGHLITSHLVQIVSVFTLARRPKLIKVLDPQLVVVDEAHHAPAATWQRILKAFPDADILGVTATPRRLDGKPLDDLFDRLIGGPTIARLTDDGFLAPCAVFTPATDPDLSEVKIVAGDYASDDLSAVMSGGVVIRTAVEEYERLCPGKPAIAFCVDINHSERVRDAFRKAGWRAEHVDGETPGPERQKLMEKLRRGKIDILSNCALISEGLDVPGVEAAILLRPTKSLTLFMQQVGRALRPGKELAFILDHAGNVKRHGLPTARRKWSLKGKMPPVDGDDLIRCPECGSINEADATHCENCGEPLFDEKLPPAEPRLPAAEVNGLKLAEAIADATTDEELVDMPYRDILRWCADDSGRLQKNRLERAAKARRYQRGWAYHCTGKRWLDVWAATPR